MVVGAMLLSGSSSIGGGLGIPKSPSFHSGLELAAATTKDYSFLSSSSSEESTNLNENMEQHQYQDQVCKI